MSAQNSAREADFPHLSGLTLSFFFLPTSPFTERGKVFEEGTLCNVLTRKLIYFINNNNNKYINIGDELKILSF